jgi:hypothetical protein
MQLVASALESRQGAGQGQVVVVAKSIIGEISASAPQRTRIFPELRSDRDRIYPELDERQVDTMLSDPICNASSANSCMVVSVETIPDFLLLQR